MNLQNATWIDVNTMTTQSTLPDRVTDLQSVYASSFVNLFNCPIGSRGPLFEPEYGSVMYQLLQEPIDLNTAQSIKLGLIDAIARWEPRVELDYNRTKVQPNFTLPGYNIQIAYTELETGNHQSIQFTTKTGVA